MKGAAPLADTQPVAAPRPPTAIDTPGSKLEPAFRHVCNCDGWSFMVRLLLWATRNNRDG